MKKQATKKPRIPASAMPPGKGPWPFHHCQSVGLEMFDPPKYRKPKIGEYFWNISSQYASMCAIDYGKDKRVILTPVTRKKSGKAQRE